MIVACAGVRGGIACDFYYYRFSIFFLASYPALKMTRDILTVILLFSLLLSISLSSEAQLAACSSSFHLLEADLLSRPQNRFLLSTKFFPPRDANPVIIKVDYVYEDSNMTNVWFWSESEFYFIQPLEIFLYTSLFFANQPYRQSSLTLELSPDCLDAQELYMKVLTQRVSRSFQVLFTASFQYCMLGILKHQGIWGQGHLIHGLFK